MQYVVFINIQSERKHITCGVPQGSIFGQKVMICKHMYIQEIAQKIYTTYNKWDKNKPLLPSISDFNIIIYQILSHFFLN